MKRIMKLISIILIAAVCSSAVTAETYHAVGNFPTPPGYGDWDSLAAEPDNTWLYFNADANDWLAAEVLPGPADIITLGYSQSNGNHWLVLEADTIAELDVMWAGTLFDEVDPVGGTVYTQGLKIYGTLDLDNIGGNERNGLWYSGAWFVDNHASGSLIQVYDGAFFDAANITVNNGQASAVNTIEQLGGSVTINSIQKLNLSLFEYQLKRGDLTITTSTIKGLSTLSNQMILNLVSGATLNVTTTAYGDLTNAIWHKLQANGIPVTPSNRDTLLDITSIDGRYLLRALFETKASNPSPVDLTEASRFTDLSWLIAANDSVSLSIPEERTWTYKVYLDTDSDPGDVTPIDAGPAVASTKRITLTNAEIGGPLAPGTYYWRVDAIDPNDGGTPVTYTGDVWTFDASAMPALTAPADSYTPEVNIDVNLEWTSDPLAVKHNVTITPYGESPILLTDKTSPFNPYADAGITMEWNKQYTWQVVALDGSDNIIGASPAWKFKVRALNCAAAGDIDGSGDCIVDLNDFAVLASEWLNCNWEEGVPSRPCP